MKTIHVPCGVLHISESKAICPICKAPQAIEVLDLKWSKSNNFSMRHKCKCGTWMHITINYIGDFVAYATEKQSVNGMIPGVMPETT